MSKADAPSFKIEWIDRGREPQNPPNPAYPSGIDVDMSEGKPGCITSLPYPARRCGVYIVECGKCGIRVGVTTAGRIDDPRSVKVPCRERSAIPAVTGKIEIDSEQTSFNGGHRKVLH